MANTQRLIQLGFLVMPAALAAQMLTLLLIASHFGASRFGIWSVIFGVMNIASFMAEMGLGTCLTKQIAEGRRPPDFYVSIALPIALVAAAVAGAVQMGVVVTAYSVNTAGWAGTMAALNILIFGGLTILSSALRGIGEIKIWMIGFLGQKVVALLFVIGILLPLDGGLAMGIAAWAVANLFLLVFYGVCIRRHGWRGQVRWRPAEMLSMIRDSLPIGLIDAAGRLAVELDAFVLALLAPSHTVGVYAAGQRIINPARNILNGAISQPTFPQLCHAAHHNPKSFVESTTELCLIQWTTGLAIALVACVVGPWAIPLLLGSNFNESAQVVQITVWVLAPSCLALQLRYVYIAASRPGRYILLNVIYLVLKTACLVGLTWRYGIWGTCYGTVGAEFLLALMLRFGLPQTMKELRIGWRSTVPTAVTALWLAGLWALGDRVWIVYALLIAYVLLAACVVLLLLRRLHGCLPPITNQPSAVLAQAGAVQTPQDRSDLGDG